MAPPDVAARSLELPAYDVAFEYALDCQVITDLEGLILNVNHPGVKFFGMDKQFLLGKPLGFLMGGLPNPFYERLVRLATGVVDSCSFEARIADAFSPARHLLVIGVLNSPATIRWVIRDTTAWKQAEAARVDLVRKLISVQEEERRKFARDLHDNVGQLLTGLTLALDVVAKAQSLTPEQQRALALAQRIAGEMKQTIHDIAHGLRSTLLERVGLHTSLLQLIADWQAHDSSAELELEADTIENARLPRDVESIVYALVQEGLTNVHRHARAKHVQVQVTRESDHIIIKISDDGVGFDVNLAAHQTGLGRLGLVGMRERAELVGGTLNISTAPGKGTIVTTWIPIPEELHQSEEPDA